MGGKPWSDIIAQAVAESVELTARGWNPGANPVATEPFAYNTYGMVATEVEVDVLTGEVEIARCDILYDCGQSINPTVDMGQVQGALMMGLGYYLTEKMVYDKTTGANLTNGTWEYKPPSVMDIPIDLRVTLLPHAPNPLGVLRSKAVGEPPLSMAASVLFAVQQAVRSAQKDAGKAGPYVPINAPCTVEEIQTLCEVEADQFSF